MVTIYEIVKIKYFVCISVEEFVLDSWLGIVSGYFTYNQDLLAMIETHVELFDTYV